MSTFTERLDRFVRWFFNVSPEHPAIPPQPPRPRRASRKSRLARAAAPREKRKSRTDHHPARERAHSQEPA